MSIRIVFRILIGVFIFFAAVITCYAQNSDSEKLGTASAGMTSRPTAVSMGARISENALGSLIADAFRWKSGSDIAIEPGGNITGMLEPGTITADEIVSLFAKNEQVVTVRITADILYQILEDGVSAVAIDESEHIQHDSVSDRFPQISGFSFVYDVSQLPGRRIRDVFPDSNKQVPLERTCSRLLTLSAPASLIEPYVQRITSGNGTGIYPEGCEADILAGYLKSVAGVIKKPASGRITVIGSSDSTLFTSLHINRYLPYLLFIFIVIALPRLIKKK